MIGFLRGEVVELRDNEILLLVGDVGYEVFLGSDPRSLTGLGETLGIHTYLNVREDAMELYGFRSRMEKDLFMELKTVSGIGAKSAIAMIAASDAEALIRAIASGDEAALRRLPGCGKKTSQRMILELGERFQKTYDLTGQATVPPIAAQAQGALRDVELALSALGYQEREIAQALSSLGDLEASDEQTLLKAALKALREG